MGIELNATELPGFTSHLSHCPFSLHEWSVVVALDNSSAKSSLLSINIILNTTTYSYIHSRCDPKYCLRTHPSKATSKHMTFQLGGLRVSNCGAIVFVVCSPSHSRPHRSILLVTVLPKPLESHHLFRLSSGALLLKRWLQLEQLDSLLNRVWYLITLKIF
jgi:hypothetical protein